MVPIVAVALYYFLNLMTGFIVSSTYAPLPVVGVAVGVVLLVVGIVLAPRDSRYNSRIFPAAFAEWDRTWACQRCGTRFVA